jgi:hypothetical protein
MFIQIHFMSKIIMVTEEEIINHPNYYDLGELVHTKYWDRKDNSKKKRSPDENFSVHEFKKSPWVCSVCGKDTSEIDSEYLQGYDHLNCRLMVDRNIEYDNCVLCGKVSPYTRSTHIDRRIGYVEGCGQGCFQPNTCDMV